MNKKFLLLFMMPVIMITGTQTVYAQKKVTALINILETLEFLKDIKTNKSKVETIAKEIKTKYKESDPVYIGIKEKFTIVKLASDNILNALVIDLMDSGKRKLFAETPGLINNYYAEQVQIYNQAVNNFNAEYQKSKEGKDAGIFNFLKIAAQLILGDLVEVAKKVAIEVLVQKLKEPYEMKSWILI